MGNGISLTIRQHFLKGSCGIVAGGPAIFERGNCQVLDLPLSVHFLQGFLDFRGQDRQRS